MRPMKDSGIEWIGCIPEGWRVSRVGNHFYFYSGDSLTNEEIKDDEGYPVYGANGIRGYYSHKNLQGVNILLGRVGALCGNVHLVNEDIWVTEHALVAVQFGVDIDIGYASLLFEAMNLRRYSKASAQPVISSEVLRQLRIPIPPIKVQINIYTYLNEKCSQIDSIIEMQEAIIEKLKEYKLSVITEAVTKGLDPNVEMKDSGIELIGDIPINWNITRLKYLLDDLIDCPHETPNYTTMGTYYVVRTSDQDITKLKTDEDMYRLNEEEYLHRIRRNSLDKDDIVYGREGSWGLASLIPESNKYCLGQRILQMRCNTDSFIPSFAVCALSSRSTYLQGSMDTIGSTASRVNISTIRNYFIPTPPLEEQKQIADFICSKLEEIDALIARITRLTSLLNEYKKSLIYEVVTGKKEV